MINLAVISIKDIIKFIKKIIIFIIILFIIFKSIFFIGGKISISSIKGKIKYNGKGTMDKTILLSNYFNNNLKKNSIGLKKVFISQLALFLSEEELMELENQEETIEFENNEELISNDENNLNQENENVISVSQNSEQLDAIPNDSVTNVIMKNNKKDTYTDVYKSVKIKNESSYILNEEMVSPNIDFNNKKDIIIYHTHTCESYTATEENNYVSTGNFRTTDLNYSVVRVGEELTNYLAKLGFNVEHDKTYHDYPAYTGSYNRSLTTINKILKQKPDSEFIIDLHRDALGSSSAYAPSVQIGDEVVAQVMFVIGTDGGGLQHSNWLNNFKLAIKIQEKANEMYPGLFKPIILRNSRYNQHVSRGACIIEVGATGNTLEQCNASMKYLSKVIQEVMK